MSDREVKSPAAYEETIRLRDEAHDRLFRRAEYLRAEVARLSGEVERQREALAEVPSRGKLYWLAALLDAMDARGWPDDLSVTLADGTVVALLAHPNLDTPNDAVQRDLRTLADVVAALSVGERDAAAQPEPRPPLNAEAVLWVAACDLVPIENRAEWVAAQKKIVDHYNAIRAAGGTIAAAQPEPRDHTEYLSPDECAPILRHQEADALLAVLEAAINAGIDPGVGLRLEDAKAAGWKIVSERFRDQDPYSRGHRIVATVSRSPRGAAAEPETAEPKT